MTSFVIAHIADSAKKLSIGILLRFSDMNPRPMGPIDTSSQSLMCLLTPQSPNPSRTARSLSKNAGFLR